MYAKRNTVTIAFFLLIILAAGIFWVSKESKEIRFFREENKKLNKQLDGSLEIAEALSTVEQKYRQLKLSWEQCPKKIIAAEEPSFTLYYLNWLSTNYGIDLDFDFVLNNINADGDILVFRFELNGEGSYYNIYRLIRFLTENPLLYKIDSFHFKGSTERADLLDFKMQLLGFSSLQKWENDQEFSFDSIRPLAQNISFHDAFKPLGKRVEPKSDQNMFSQKVEKPAPPPPVDDGLIDIEKSSLQAVANGQVYLKDKSGKLITLKMGDKVHLGSLERINQNKSEIEFTLHKNGEQKKVTLGLGYKK